MLPKRREVVIMFAMALLGFNLFGAVRALAGPKADLWPLWEKHDPNSDKTIDHSAWTAFLGQYVVADHPSGVNRVRYGDVSKEDLAKLNGYVDMLAGTEISSYAKPEQKAYWINLYNAVTVKLIIDRYPVESIRKIKPSFFSIGPWDMELVEVEGEKVTLNDMEQRILRPIFRDERVHYALNCASIGCPNLQPVAYTPANIEELLEKGAIAYVNHPRGAAFDGGDLTVSSIYNWYEPDFGGSEEGVLEHLSKYAEGELAQKLEAHSGGYDHAYDWSLNAP